MKADLAAKLQSAMRGGITAKTGVAGVMGVVGVSATCSKPLKLQRLRPLRVKNDELAKDEIRGVDRLVAVLTEPDDVELEERKAMAMGGVPVAYADAWGRLQCQGPIRVADAEWRQAIDDAGRFLDQWGSLAVEFQWTAGELFDVPREGRPGGLAWFLNGETIRAIGPEAAVTKTGQVFATHERPMTARERLPNRRRCEFPDSTTSAASVMRLR